MRAIHDTKDLRFPEAFKDTDSQIAAFKQVLKVRTYAAASCALAQKC